MQTLSPQQIVGGFNRKDPKASTWIFNTYNRVVAGMVSKLTGDSPDAEDLVLTVFGKLLAYPGHFETVKEIRDFIHRITANICQDYRKHQQIEKAHAAGIAEYYHALSAENIERAESYGYFGDLLYLAIEKIPPKSKDVFSFSYLLEFSDRQIAERLGIAEKTVANHKTIARKILKMELEKKGGREMLLLFIILLNLLYGTR